MLALLCAGQGELSPEILDLAAREPQAAPVFVQAERLLGRDPRALLHAQRELVSDNRVSQLLTVTTALAHHACIADALPARFMLTGYSVGELAAWGIAGVWSVERALALTHLRALAMDEAGGREGRLGYVRGLSRARLEMLLTRYRCALAIRCPHDLFVVGGRHGEVVALCQEALALGAVHSGMLAISVASHTALLAEAVAPIQAALAAEAKADPAQERVLLSGGDGARVFSASEASARLAAQVAQPIDWVATMESLIERACDKVLDLGPGHALSNMFQSFAPQVSCRAMDAFRSIAGVRAWLASS